MDFDHEAFVNDDFLGVDAIFTPAGGQAQVVRVCFTLGVEDVILGSEIGTQGIAGRAGCPQSYVSGVKVGDVLEIAEVAYRVVTTPETDETGWTTMLLGKRYT